MASFSLSEAASFLARRLDSTQLGTRTFTTTRFGVFAAEAALGSCSSRAASYDGIFFDDFYLTAACVRAAASPGCPCSVHRFCYGHVYGVFVMDMLLRMLPHSPWLLATDASMF